MKAKQTGEKQKMGGVKKALMITGIVIGAILVLSLVCLFLFVPTDDRITGTETPKPRPTEAPAATAQLPEESAAPAEEPQTGDETESGEDELEEEDPALIGFDAAVLSSGDEAPAEIPGSYTTADGYEVIIRQSEDGDAYPFTITFSMVGRNYVTGVMTLGREVAFEYDGFDSCDGGSLTFYQKDGALCLKYAGDVNGSFDSRLEKTVVKDYSGYDLDSLTGTYHSPTEAYEVTLMATPGRSFFVDLRYANGMADHGDAVPGVESALENGAVVTVDINDDGTVHLKLVSAVRADGVFDEDLIPGALGEVTEIHSARLLKDLSDGTRFAYLCQIEQRCAELRVGDVTSRPYAYCDNEIYRFAGKVVQAVEGGFLLQLCSRSDCENNLIVCKSDEIVQTGEELCVYGVGTGTGSYTRTNEYGRVKEFETLLLDVGYTIRNAISYGTSVPEFMQDFVYGEYSLKEYETKFLLESDLTFDEHGINGRDMTIKSVSLKYAVTSVTDWIGNSVSVVVETQTTSHRGEPCTINFYFKLNGDGMRYVGLRDTDTIAAMDVAGYDKMS